MYELGKEIDFKRIRKEQDFENRVYGFILGFCLTVLFIMGL